MTDDLMKSVRRRLVEISDELQTLAADDFPGKHRLNTEADDLRRQLKSLTSGDPEILRRWAERAGTKNRRTDEDVEAAKAAIVSLGEGGSSW